MNANFNHLKGKFDSLILRFINSPSPSPFCKADIKEKQKNLIEYLWD